MAVTSEPGQMTRHATSASGDWAALQVSCEALHLADDLHTDDYHVYNVHTYCWYFICMTMLLLQRRLASLSQLLLIVFVQCRWLELLLAVAPIVYKQMTSTCLARTLDMSYYVIISCCSLDQYSTALHSVQLQACLTIQRLSASSSFDAVVQHLFWTAIEHREKLGLVA